MVSHSSWTIAAAGVALLFGGCGEAPAPPEPAAPAPQVVASSAGSWRVEYRARPDPIPLNEPFGLTARIFSADAPDVPRNDVELAVDAAMPQHQHGMNRRASVRRDGAGGFVASELLFHMPGEWRLYFDVTYGGLTERAECVVRLD